MSSSSITLTPKIRGGITTVASGTLAGVFNVIGIRLGVPELVSAIVSLYIIGNLLAYMFDILFAKNTFIKNGVSREVDYSNYLFRFRWLLGSFFSPYFYRFFVTIIIDTIIAMSILIKLIDLMNKYDIHFWMRDTVTAALVALFTFILYNNVLRFDWAYNDNSDPLMDMLVLMWCSLVLMIFSLTYKHQKKDIR